MSIRKALILMINEIRQEVVISLELRKKINWAIKYTSSKVNIINGASIRLEHTNIAYIDPHKIIINNNIFFLMDQITFMLMI